QGMHTNGCCQRNSFVFLFLLIFDHIYFGLVAAITLASSEVAIPVTYMASPQGTSLSMCSTTEPPLDVSLLFNSPSSKLFDTFFSLTKYCRSLVTVTETFCISMVLALVVGRFTGRPEGVMNDEVSMKNTSNRK